MPLQASRSSSARRGELSASSLARDGLRTLTRLLALAVAAVAYWDVAFRRAAPPWEASQAPDYSREYAQDNYNYMPQDPDAGPVDYEDADDDLYREHQMSNYHEDYRHLDPPWLILHWKVDVPFPGEERLLEVVGQALALAADSVLVEGVLTEHRIFLFRPLDVMGDTNLTEKQERWQSLVSAPEEDPTLAELLERSFPAMLDHDLCDRLLELDSEAAVLNGDSNDTEERSNDTERPPQPLLPFQGANATSDRSAYVAACHRWRHHFDYGDDWGEYDDYPFHYDGTYDSDLSSGDETLHDVGDDAPVADEAATEM